MVQASGKKIQTGYIYLGLSNDEKEEKIESKEVTEATVVLLSS